MIYDILDKIKDPVLEYIKNNEEKYEGYSEEAIDNATSLITKLLEKENSQSVPDKVKFRIILDDQDIYSIIINKNSSNNKDRNKGY